MRKIVSFASTPNEAIKWSELGKYKRLSKEELYIYDFENIEEVHFIGSKKGENDYEIEETKWGIYINMEEAILLYICSWQTKEFQLLEKINKNIKCLDIRFTSINELDISEFDKINKLVLSNNRYLGLVNGIEKISGLRELYLNNSSIEKNPDLNNFPEIYVLNLSNTLISDLEGDEVRRNCKFLDLSNTKIKSCKTIQIFPNLRRLSLQETDIVSLKGIEQLKKLESLNCRDTRIETINEVMNLEALTSLNISYTNIKTLDKVMFPNTIRSLVMDGIGIKTIPVNICMLKNLRKLGISNMHLDSLPPEILDLQLNFNIDEEARKRNGINLFNTKIDNMDESVLQQPRTIISAWFKNNNRVRIPKKLNEAKVVFLGDGGAGKTFSIQRLLNNCEMQEEFSGESTPGISIQDCKYEINGEEILIHYWDFGGQEIMHSMHRMFLTKRTLYVVFVNARDNTQDERARYWLHNIKSFADNSPVIMVINQMDQNPSASVNESSLRRLYPELRDIIKMSAITFTKEAFEDALQKQIIRNIKSMQIIDTMFSDSWIQLKKCLQEMQEFYIDNKRFMDICDICEVEADHTIRMQLLDWFSDLGISFCYSDSHQLANYMVLRPDWITNAIYIILFNGVKYAKNGIIDHNSLFELLSNKKNGKRVLQIEYSNSEIEYVLGVVRKFKLSYRLNDISEFIPMLCDRNEPDIVDEYMNRTEILEYQIEYKYLPLNVMHRLMVEMRNDIVIEYVWLTGALFEAKEMMLSALVKAEDNILKIYIKAGNKLFPASSYLGFIRNIVNNINRDMGLCVEEKIIYKEGVLREKFDYLGLVDSFKYGNKTQYSSTLKKNIDIEEILKMAEGEEEKLRKQLKNDLIDACKMMQSNSIYWDCKEDVRNTYIRDILRAKKYIVSDQTLIGKSESGKSSGELDIEVFEKWDKPLALMEALIISSDGLGDIRYWNRHLKKLLDNYNPIGSTGSIFD